MSRKESDTIHLIDISQSTLVYFNIILYFNSHFYTSIVIVTYESFAFSPSERGKYSQSSVYRRRCCPVVVVVVLVATVSNGPTSTRHHVAPGCRVVVAVFSERFDRTS